MNLSTISVTIPIKNATAHVMPYDKNVCEITTAGTIVVSTVKTDEEHSNQAKTLNKVPDQ